MTLWPPEKSATLRHLVEREGLSYRQAGALMGISKNAAVGRGQRMGLKSHREPKGSRRDEPAPRSIEERLAAVDIFPGPGRCVFPIGHPGKAAFRFCCAPTAGTHPYCAEHRRVTMTRIPATGAIPDPASRHTERSLARGNDAGSGD